MFLLGIILIIVGIAIAALLAHPQAHVLGGLVVVVGLIFLVVALVGPSDVAVHDRGAVEPSRSSWGALLAVPWLQRLRGRAAVRGSREHQ